MVTFIIAYGVVSIIINVFICRAFYVLGKRH